VSARSAHPPRLRNVTLPWVLRHRSPGHDVTRPVGIPGIGCRCSSRRSRARFPPSSASSSLFLTTYDVEERDTLARRNAGEGRSRVAVTFLRIKSAGRAMRMSTMAGRVRPESGSACLGINRAPYLVYLSFQICLIALSPPSPSKKRIPAILPLRTRFFITKS